MGHSMQKYTLLTIYQIPNLMYVLTSYALRITPIDLCT